MRTQQKVSAIITNYNHGEFLYESVVNLVRQSRKPDEIIIVDDGSRDHSRDVLELLQKEHPELIVIFHEKNQGVNAAVKTAIDRSTGDFLTTLGADDPLNLVFFEHAMAVHTTNPTIGICSGEYRLKCSGVSSSFPITIKLADRARAFSPEQMANIYRSRIQLSVPTAPAIWRRSAWNDVGGMQPELGWLSDWFAALVSISRHGYGYVPGIMQTIRDNPKSYSRSGMKEYEAHIKLLVTVLETLEKPAFTDAQTFFRIHAVLSRFGFKILNVILADKRFLPYLSAELLATTIQTEALSLTWSIENLKKLSAEEMLDLTRTTLSKFSESLLNIAFQYKRQGRFADAIEVCIKARDASPQNTACMGLMDELHERRQRNETALKPPQLASISP